MNPGYRADIDGLRAIAVLSVILFHSGFDILGGGYAGVDVFFVISGYLITSIITGELQAGNFSLVRFYERRCRRILPALFAVLLITLIVGLLLQHPRDLVNGGKSITAAAMFYSNILFYTGSGYFAVTADQKPLLHTWSLAIEEQYYVVYPLLLMAIARFNSGRYAIWLIALLLASLASSIWILGSDSNAAFFLSPFRAWELLLGGMLAIRCLPVIGNRPWRELLSMLGLAMVLGSFLAFTDETPFPGYAALLPTIGTALIIHAGTPAPTLVSSLLGLRPVVFIGLISYSLYLWHWPVLVFTRYYTIVEPDTPVRLAMLVVIFFLALASWKFVEQPIRRRVILQQRGRLFKVAAAITLLFAASGYLVVKYDGFPARYQQLTGLGAQQKDPVWDKWKGCGSAIKRFRKNLGLCRIGDPQAETSFMVWGDSHATAIAHAIDIGASTHQKAGEIAFKIGCPPLVGVDRVDDRNCARFNEYVLQHLSTRPDLKFVIVAARWPISALGSRYRQEGGKPVRLSDKAFDEDRPRSNFQIFEPGLKRTVQELLDLGKQVILVKSVPEVGYDVLSAQFVASISGRDVDALIAPTAEEYLGRVGDVDRAIASIAGAGLARSIDPAALMCDSQRCIITDNGRLLYRDDDHLSTYGAEFVSSVFADFFSHLDDR